MSEFKQLCVWEGTLLGDSTNQEFEDFFKSQGFEVKLAEEVVTEPDLDKNGFAIKGTGGRHDILFYIATSDIPRFAIERFQFGIKWWEDVVSYNNRSYLYSNEILAKYPATW